MILLGLVSAAVPAFADTVRYSDGRTVQCIVLSESEKSVTVNLYGQKVDIPRVLISSVEKAAPEENAAMEAGWESLNKRYMDESRKGRERSPLPPSRRDAPAPSPTATPPGGEARLPQRASPAPNRPFLVRERQPGDAPQEDARQKEMRRKQDVRRAIVEKRVIPGMTQKEVRSAWGWPELTHPVHGVDIHTDRWTYRREGEGLVDLYFTNGVLTHVGR